MTREELNAAGDWAFPSGDGEYGGGPNHCPGMTLRDYFAGQAMVSRLAWFAPYDSNFNRVAADAYRLADAMLAARSPHPTLEGGEPVHRATESAETPIGQASIPTPRQRTSG